MCANKGLSHEKYPFTFSQLAVNFRYRWGSLTQRVTGALIFINQNQIYKILQVKIKTTVLGYISYGVTTTN